MKPSNLFIPKSVLARLVPRYQMWTWSAIIASIFVGVMVSLLHFQQQWALGQVTESITNMHLARIELSKGFLYVSLSGDPDAPFDREEGLALLRQATSSLEASLNTDIGSMAASDVADFEQKLDDFQSTLEEYSAATTADSKLKTKLRIAFHDLERQTDQVDAQSHQRLDELESRLNVEFGSTLGLSGILLIGICAVVILTGNAKEKSDMDRKRVEKASRIALTKYQTLFESFPLGITVADTAGNILETNPVAEKLLGISQEEQKQREIDGAEWQIIRTDGTPMPSEEYASVRALKEGRKVENVEMGIVKPDASVTWINVTAAPLSLEGFGVVVTYGDITERKQAEQALRFSEAKWRSLFETCPVGIALANAYGEFLDANPAYLAQLGYTHDEIAKKHYKDFTPPKWHAREAQNVAQLKATGLPIYFEKEHIRKDGTVFPVALTGWAIHDEDGVPNTLGVFVQDIGERKHAEEALRESESRYRLLVETSIEGIWAMDREHRTSYVNQSMADMLGYEPAEMLGKKVEEFFFPEDMESHQTHMEKRHSGQDEVYERRFRRRDGSQLWTLVSARVQKDSQGNFNGSFGMFTDITERKQAEEKLANAERRYRALIENATDGIVLVSVDGKFKYASPSVGRIFGYSPEEALQGDAAQMTHPEDLPMVLAELEKLIENPSYIPTLQYRFRHKNGDWRWLESTFSNLLALPSVEAIIINFHDIHERKNAEQASQESEERLRQIASALREVIWLRDAQTRQVLYVNPAFEELTGQTCKNFYENRDVVANAIHPDDRELVTRALDQRSKGMPFEQEHRIIHLDGIVRWVSSRSFPVRNEAGEVYRWASIMEDITGRKREERYTQARLRLANLSHETMDMDVLMRLMLDEAEALTDSQIGFFHFMDDDQNTISLQAWSTNTLNTLCTAEGKGQHYPVAQAGVWADGIRSGEPRIYNDYAGLPHRRELPEGHAPVTRLISLPIKRNNLIVAAIGVGNKPTDYDEHDLEMVKRLAEDAFDIILRKRAEEALRESEEKYRGLMESLNNAVSTVDINGRFTYMNDMAAEKLGGTPQELIGRNINELFPEPFASLQLAGIQNIFRVDQETVFETQSMGTDGLRWYRFALQPLHNETGQVAQVLVNATDIHDLKTAQQELQELNRTLEEKVNQRTAEVQDLYDNAPTGYHSLDANGNFVLINQTELNWLGYTREEVIGHAARDFMTEASRNVFRENFPTILQRGWLKDVELEFVRKEGSILPVSLSATALRDEAGNFVMSRSTISDITEHKEAERALRESEEQNRLLFEESPVPIALLDETGHIIHANRAYEQLTGFPRSTLYGKTSEEMGLADAQVINQLSEAMLEAMSRQENFAIAEHELTSADGTRKIVESRIYLLPINSVNHILVTSNDISTHKKAEETLRRANVELERAMRLKDEFLATMSHELRTPLTGILGLSEALQLETYGSLTEKQLRTVKNIEDSGRHLLALINDVLDLSKIEAGKLTLEITHCSLGDICQASLQLTKGMAHQKRHHVGYSAPNIPIFLDVDPRRIKQVLVNLFSNAIKFTPEKGELGLVVEPDEANQRVRLVVWDKGIGIKTENLSRLFLPFTQIDGSLAREYSGTGLGLALVRRLVEFHNGTVEVESAFGEGSRFIVTLPWTPQTARDNLPDMEENEELQHGTADENISTPMILIADDNQILLDMLGDFLEAKKYRTTKAQSGMELLEKIENIKPDVILMDIQMPGMDGLETIRRVRAHKNVVIASTPIIAVTALAMTGDRERCLGAGANDYISKPVKLRDLIETLNQLTGGRA